MTPAETASSHHKPKASESVFRLIYKSRSRVPASDRESELGKIFSVARRKNAAQGITGALLLYDDWFAQTLEGDEGAVRKIFAVIEQDERHDGVEVREEGPVEARVFARWSMAASRRTRRTRYSLDRHQERRRGSSSPRIDTRARARARTHARFNARLWARLLIWSDKKIMDQTFFEVRPIDCRFDDHVRDQLRSVVHQHEPYAKPMARPARLE